MPALAHNIVHFVAALVATNAELSTSVGSRVVPSDLSLFSRIKKERNAGDEQRTGEREGKPHGDHANNR